MQPKITASNAIIWWSKLGPPILAEAVAILTYRQTALMLLGALMGLITLGAAIYAAYYAKRAAEAAERELEHSRHTARAYITPKTEEITYSPAATPQIILRLEWTNTGNTPAHRMVVKSLSYFAYQNGGRVNLEGGRYHQGTLAPGHPVTMSPEITLDADEMRALLEEKGEVRVDLTANYVTAFGEEWTFDHELMVNKESIEKRTVWTLACRQEPAKRDNRVPETNHQRRLQLGDDGD